VTVGRSKERDEKESKERLFTRKYLKNTIEQATYAIQNKDAIQHAIQEAYIYI